MSGWLVVNENVRENDRTRQQLNARGLSCETAHNCQTAEQRMGGNTFDVVVLNEPLPGGDELYHRLPAIHPSSSPKVVVVGECSDIGHDSSSSDLIRCESTMLGDLDQLLTKLK